MGDYNDAFMRNNNNASVQGRTKAQNRSNVMQLKLIGQSHPTGLTANLLKLFVPRPPLEYKPPLEKRKCPPYSGMAQLVSTFAEKGDPEYQPPVQKAETPVQKKARIHKIRLEEGAKKAAEELEKYDPNNDPNISGDPYKTLFVAKLNYETSENKIKREFEAYGPIKRVRLITDKTSNKPRGYAFIEYMHTRDMKAAYKQADGKKIDNRRVLVDVERGRTVPNWRPRRLGGGLGTTRVGGEDASQKYSGRELQQSGGPSRSEEPRMHDDRHGERDREKSREMGRDNERQRERSCERSYDRPRDRDHREDRHRRDREKNRDKDRERDRGRGCDQGRDRERGRDRGRDYKRDRERDRDHNRPRDRDRDRDRDYEFTDPGCERGHSHDREYDYERMDSKHDRDRHGERERNYDHIEPEDDPVWYEKGDQGHRRAEAELDRGRYEYHDYHQVHMQHDNMDIQGACDHDDQSDHDNERYDQMEGGYYDRAASEKSEKERSYDRAASEKNEEERTQNLDREYRRSLRSRSGEYEY